MLKGRGAHAEWLLTTYNLRLKDQIPKAFHHTFDLPSNQTSHIPLVPLRTKCINSLEIIGGIHAMSTFSALLGSNHSYQPHNQSTLTPDQI